jgi:hypothetical protein
MSDPMARTILLYVLSIAAGAAAAGLGVLATQLAGADPINWRPIIAAAIGPIVAGLAASRLPRPEGAALAAQIDSLKAQGVPRAEMVVVSQEEAIRGIAEAPPPDAGRLPRDE